MISIGTKLLKSLMDVIAEGDSDPMMYILKV